MVWTAAGAVLLWLAETVTVTEVGRWVTVAVVVTGEAGGAVVV